MNEIETENSDTTKQKGYVCNEEIDNLDVHFLTSHAENDIDNGPNLKTHIKSVNDTIKVHKCETCGKAFAFFSRLKKHVKTVHEGIKDHKCEMCKKSYSTIHYLKVGCFILPKIGFIDYPQNPIIWYTNG